MDQTTISEAFSEHLSLVTTGTDFDTNVDLESFLTGIEFRVRELSYNLWMDAQANKLANHMEQEKEAHFARLYEFSYGVSMYEENYFVPKGTEKLALMIIDEKASYERRIKRIRLQYNRFKEICKLVSVEDKKLLVRYFEKSQKVDYEDLRNTILKNLTLIGEYY